MSLSQINHNGHMKIDVFSHKIFICVKMQRDYDKVYQFHKTFGIIISHTPCVDVLHDDRRVSLRLRLINEEYEEFCHALHEHNLVEMIDALADLLYVIYGTCISFGLQIEQQYPQVKNLESINRNDHFFTNNCLQFVSQMKAEITTLQNAMLSFSFSETCDTLKRMLWMTYHCGYSIMHVDLSVAFDIVHQSNMSKLCLTKNEAIETVDWYISHEAQRYKEPSYRKSDDGLTWVVYDKSTGKVLKNIHYTPPKLSHLL
jgi:predicted HAD superfamily Cof-like phosphohydrolase